MAEIEKRIISNQVYEAIQPPTLENEPVAKSTILYANRFSGVNPVSCTDPDLETVLNSTIGLTGNNVLVQLRKKLSVFKNGPWYIDSRDGILYIHNRKYSDGTVVNYTYYREVGELLSANFRMVNVYKPFAGLSTMADAMSKAVSSLSSQIEDYVSPDKFNMTPSLKTDTANKQKANDQAAGRRSSTRVDNTQAILGSKAYGLANKYNQRILKYDPKTHKFRETTVYAEKGRAGYAKSAEAKGKAAKAAERKTLTEKTYKNTNARTMYDALLKNHPDVQSASQYYLNIASLMGVNSPEAKQAAKQLIAVAGKHALYLGKTQKVYGTWLVTLTTKPFIYLKDVPRLKQEAIEQWEFKHHNLNFYDVRLVGVDKYISVGKGVQDQHDSGANYFNHQQRVEFQIEYKGLGSYGVYTNGGRFMSDLIARGLNPKKPLDLSGVSNMMANAARNAGKGHSEKKLQAEVKVVGNPIIEDSQQVGLFNVGKKHSGIWYVKAVSHSLTPADGYMTIMTLERQGSTLQADGNSSVVHTQKDTVDNQEASPQNTQSKRNSPHKKFKTSKNRTSTKKLSVVKSNKEWTYQDAYNVGWTWEENLYVNSIVSRVPPNMKKRAIQQAAFDIADWHYANPNGVNGRHSAVIYNKNTKQVTFDYLHRPDVTRTDVKQSANYYQALRRNNVRR